MRFRKSAKIEAGLHQIDIVPLIDCVFLLLVFFMLTSSFVDVGGINVKLPKTITSDEVDSRSLTVVISSEDIMYIAGKPHTAKEIEAFLKKDNYESIFIKADSNSSLGVVVEVWDMCKRLGIEKIGIATTFEG
jgi:biopolymer transport protein ExbD